MGAKGVHAYEFAHFFSDLDVDQSGDADADEFLVGFGRVYKETHPDARPAGMFAGKAKSEIGKWGRGNQSGEGLYWHAQKADSPSVLTERHSLINNKEHQITTGGNESALLRGQGGWRRENASLPSPQAVGNITRASEDVDEDVDRANALALHHRMLAEQMSGARNAKHGLIAIGGNSNWLSDPAGEDGWS